MKYLNLLTVFTRPSIFAAAMAIAVTFAFVSNAAADEKNFDALGGVTAQALTPAAMDAIQGAGKFFMFDRTGELVRIRGIGASFNMNINLSKSGSGKRTTCAPSPSACP